MFLKQKGFLLVFFFKGVQIFSNFFRRGLGSFFFLMFCLLIEEVRFLQRGYVFYMCCVFLKKKSCFFFKEFLICPRFFFPRGGLFFHRSVVFQGFFCQMFFVFPKSFFSEMFLQGFFFIGTKVFSSVFLIVFQEFFQKSFVFQCFFSNNLFSKMCCFSHKGCLFQKKIINKCCFFQKIGMFFGIVFF